MEKVKVFIVEDEAITVTILRDALEEAGYEVCGTADEAEVALQLIQKTQPDIAILDINLIGKKDGIWLAEQINNTAKIPFLFLTSFGDKASIERAVRTRPYGYLLKPFDDSNIFTAINIALRNFSQNNMAVLPTGENNKTQFEDTLAIKDFMFIREKNHFVKLHFREILFAQADKNYVDIVTPDHKFTIRTPLKDLMSSLPKGQFIQINRSSVVNFSNIDSYNNDEVATGTYILPLTDNFKSQFLADVQAFTDGK